MSGISSSKFIRILRTLDTEEFNAFGRWLESPRHNSNKKLIRLFEKIKKFHPEFDSKNFTKERLYRQVSIGKKFSSHQMDKLLSAAYMQAEQFLIFENLTCNESLKTDLLNQEFQHRHLETDFFKSTEKEINRLESKAVKDWEDHLDLLRYCRRAYNHPSPNARVPSDQSIVKMDTHLDLTYALEKAAIINEKIFRNRILKNENHHINTELKKWHAVVEGIDHPSVEFFKKRFAYSEENMLEEFRKLEADFIKRFDELNPKDQKTHLFSLLNDLVVLKRRKLVGVEEFLSLYKFGLNTKTLIVHGHLTQITFVTIVSYSNTAKEFEFTEYFIKNYIEYLPQKIKEDAKNWALANTSYRKGKLLECLDFLLNHDFKIQYFQRLSKVINIQAYFDLYLENSTYQEFLLNFSNAYEKWVLREKKLSQLKKIPILRFIQKCRELVKYHSAVNFEEDKVEKILDGKEIIDSRIWLSNKRDQILRLRKNRRGLPK